MSSSLYGILNVDRNASQDEIQKSYKLLSKSFHPDKQQNHVDAPTTFLELKHAHDILSNPVLRLTYDEYGYDAVLIVQHRTSRRNQASGHDEDEDTDDEDVTSNHRESEDEQDRSLLQLLATLIHDRKDFTGARKLIEQELQNQRYQRYQTMNYYYHRLRRMFPNIDGGAMENYRIVRQGSVEVACTTVHSPLLDEGYTSQDYSNLHEDTFKNYDAIEGNWMEVEKSKLGFQLTYPMAWKPASYRDTETSHLSTAGTYWNWTVGGNTSIKHGQGQSSVNLGIGFVPSTGTDMNAQCSVDLAGDKEQYKLSLDTSRVMSDGTYISTSLTTIPDTNHFAYNIFSHRSLFQNKFSGTWGFGLGSNLDFHFFMFSLTSIRKYIPRCTAQVSLGTDPFPFRFTVQHDWASSSQQTTRKALAQSIQNHGHRGEISLGLSTNANIELKVTSTRTLSRFCSLSMGIQHITTKGLTWILRVSRGETSFTLPITVTLASSVNYWTKAVYVSLWTWLVDMSIHDWLYDDSNQSLTGDSFFISSPYAKNRDQALKELYMMERAVDCKKLQEMASENGGLIIIHGTYEDREGESLDVTTALQFWVVDSRLNLCSGSKKHLLGFYDVRPMYMKREEMNLTHGWWNVLFQLLTPRTHPNKAASENQNHQGPYLTVRYRSLEGVFEITIKDDEPLVLPSPAALKLGGKNIQ